MKKKAITLLLMLCVVVSLFSGMIVTANAESPIDFQDVAPIEDVTDAADEVAATSSEGDFASVFKANIFVKENEDAGLCGNTNVAFSTLRCTGTLYLPGTADESQLFFSWDNDSLVVSKDGVVYENGTAPVAPAGEYASYKVSKGNAVAYVNIKTVKGSSDVAAMFLKLDENLGTIKAMNSDPDHETQCFGAVNFAGKEYSYISMKGRGNSTWSMDKKPYNITFHKKADYDKKQAVELIQGVEAKKWSLLANSLDNSLLRNKIALDLAQNLGIGLDARFVDLWMNGEYLGNYLMTPKNDYNAPKGGYALENDNYLDSEDPQFKIPGMYEIGAKIHDDGYYNLMTVKDIGDDAVAAGEDASTIEAYFDEAWAALENYKSEDYQNYFDMDSWAKMFLMYEVSKTYDCFSGSLLMHRDGLTENDKLIAGPTWDYDNSFGRTLHKFLVAITIPNQMTAEGWYNDSIGMVAVNAPISLLQELGKHESFMKKVAEVFNDNKWAFDDIVPNIERQRAILEKSALMNNVKWGTHHLGSYYVVVPAYMGTGKYMVNYEVTTSWNSYVNNMIDFSGKRVMWLADHLYAEYPVGAISGETAVNSGDTLKLTADLSAGNTANTFQWQSTADGSNWSDIIGAKDASLKLVVNEEDNGMQYRCIVKNAGVNIVTTHTPVVKASAQTVLEPVTVTVSADPASAESKEVSLKNGTLALVMDGKEMGEFTFASKGGSWSICNVDGKYLAADGKKLVLADEPFAWSYNNGVFSTDTKLSYTSLGKLLGISHSAKVYLTVSGDELAVSTGKGPQASFWTIAK